MERTDTVDGTRKNVMNIDFHWKKRQEEEATQGKTSTAACFGREGDRHRDRQTETETDRQTHRQTETQRDRYRDRDRDRERRERDRQRDGETERSAEGGRQRETARGTAKPDPDKPNPKEAERRDALPA
jgi:hypothetical protein